MSHLQNLQRLRSNNLSTSKKPLLDIRNQKALERVKHSNLTTTRLNSALKKDEIKQFLESKSIPKGKQCIKKGISVTASQFSVQKRKLNMSSFSPLSTQILKNGLGLTFKPSRKDAASNPLTQRKQIQFYGISTTQQLKLQSDKIVKSNFDIIFAIGKGGFGKVWKVQMKKTGKIYAMKEMYKTKIINKKSINSIMNQRDLLSKLSHPFLINMSFAFQDKQNLYLIMDYLNGGDLRYHIMTRRRFTQNEAKFFISCLLLCVQYLHKNSIIHRDIKPQNMVFDSKGYLRLTDLGISRKWREDNGSDTSGTPGYMSPQVMCHRNHSFAADYFAIGVLAYQLMVGKRPYLGKDRKQIRDHILSKQASIKLDDVPNGWSKESADFINKLLMRNPLNRLGTQNSDQVREHPWLKQINWIKLLNKQIQSPFIPKNIEQNYEDYKYQISEDTIIDNAEQNALVLRDYKVQQLFKGYQYKTEAKLTTREIKTSKMLKRQNKQVPRKIIKDSWMKK